MPFWCDYIGYLFFSLNTSHLFVILMDLEDLTLLEILCSLLLGVHFLDIYVTTEASPACKIIIVFITSTRAMFIDNKVSQNISEKTF